MYYILRFVVVLDFFNLTFLKKKKKKNYFSKLPEKVTVFHNISCFHHNISFLIPQWQTMTGLRVMNIYLYYAREPNLFITWREISSPYISFHEIWIFFFLFCLAKYVRRTWNFFIENFLKTLKCFFFMIYKKNIYYVFFRCILLRDPDAQILLHQKGSSHTDRGREVNKIYTGCPVKHDCVFLVPCKKCHVENVQCNQNCAIPNKSCDSVLEKLPRLIVGLWPVSQ